MASQRNPIETTIRSSANSTQLTQRYALSECGAECDGESFAAVGVWYGFSMELVRTTEGFYEDLISWYACGQRSKEKTHGLLDFLVNWTCPRLPSLDLSPSAFFVLLSPKAVLRLPPAIVLLEPEAVFDWPPPIVL
jgi:hypothetical protein